MCAQANQIHLVKNIALILIIAMFFSCKNDIKTVSALTGTDTIPELKTINIDYTRSDTGIIQARITSPLLEIYGGKKPYNLFPKGLKITFYDPQMNIKSELSADYGKKWEKGDKLLELRNNVVFRNFGKNELLETEELFWNEKKKEINSHANIKITTPKDTIFGTGLISDEEFNEYDILNISGKAEIENEKIKK
jgi:LPS export ABC transporter protein LptC